LWVIHSANQSAADSVLERVAKFAALCEMLQLGYKCSYAFFRLLNAVVEVETLHDRRQF